jgi:hypothetical protein
MVRRILEQQRADLMEWTDECSPSFNLMYSHFHNDRHIPLLLAEIYRKIWRERSLACRSSKLQVHNVLWIVPNLNFQLVAN